MKKKFRILLLLALLMTAATGAWAQDAKHLITATYFEQTRSLEQPLPYATTIGEFYEAVTGQSFNDLISTMSALEMPLTGISSNKTDVVSIGDLNGASTPVTVKADGKATVGLRFGNYVQGIFVNVVPPLYAYVKDGVKDAYEWTVKVGEGQAQALPIGGLKEGDPVTLQYNGRLKVKGVKATSDAAPTAPADNPAPTTASIEDYTAGTFGWNGDGSAATGLPTINTFAANDKISILSAKNTNPQFTTSAGGASATFSGTAADDSKFYAVYPYTAGLTLSGDVISGIVIPTSQWNSGWNSTSNYSGWDPKAPIAYATTTGSSLTFHNACAILKVTITGSGTWAIFTISANEPLAGTFSLDTSTGTLTPTSGSTTVAVGTDFSYTNCFETQGGNKTAYIAIAPGTYTNFTLYLTNEDGGHNSKTKSGSVTFEAGKIYDLGSYNVEYF